MLMKSTTELIYCSDEDLIGSHRNFVNIFCPDETFFHELQKHTVVCPENPGAFLSHFTICQHLSHEVSKPQDTFGQHLFQKALPFTDHEKKI